MRSKFLVFAAWLTLLEWAAAVPVRLQFDQPDPDLMEVHLRELTPHGESVFLAAFPLFPTSVGPASPVITITADLAVGQKRVQVAVRNAHGWSELSEPLTVVVTAPLTICGHVLTTASGDHVLLGIQYSDDLKAWSDTPRPARFQRIKATQETR